MMLDALIKTLAGQATGLVEKPAGRTEGLEEGEDLVSFEAALLQDGGDETPEAVLSVENPDETELIETVAEESSSQNGFEGVAETEDLDNASESTVDRFPILLQRPLDTKANEASDVGDKVEKASQVSSFALKETDSELASPDGNGIVFSTHSAQSLPQTSSMDVDPHTDAADKQSTPTRHQTQFDSEQSLLMSKPVVLASARDAPAAAVMSGTQLTDSNGQVLGGSATQAQLEHTNLLKGEGEVAVTRAAVEVDGVEYSVKQRVTKRQLPTLDTEASLADAQGERVAEVRVKAEETVEARVASVNTAPQTSQIAATVLPVAERSFSFAKPRSEVLDVESIEPSSETGLSQSERSGSSTISQTQALSRGDLPRQVTLQLAQALKANPGGPVEVTLQPEELGRVKMVVTAGEAGVTISVLADRPETFDMLRRHAAQLSKELMGLGFGDVDLSFEQGNQAGQGRLDQEAERTQNRFGVGEGLDQAEMTEAPSGKRSDLDHTKALDIRI